MARRLLSSAGFRNLTQQLLEVADDVCDGRAAMIHEGGYSPVYLPFCGLAVIEELAGARTLTDPYLALVQVRRAEAEVNPPVSRARRGTRSAAR